MNEKDQVFILIYSNSWEETWNILGVFRSEDTAKEYLEDWLEDYDDEHRENIRADFDIWRMNVH